HDPEPGQSGNLRAVEPGARPVEQEGEAAETNGHDARQPVQGREPWRRDPPGRGGANGGAGIPQPAPSQDPLRDSRAGGGRHDVMQEQATPWAKAMGWPGLRYSEAPGWTRAGASEYLSPGHPPTPSFEQKPRLSKGGPFRYNQLRHFLPQEQGTH